MLSLAIFCFTLLGAVIYSIYAILTDGWTTPEYRLFLNHIHVYGPMSVILLITFFLSSRERQ